MTDDPIHYMDLIQIGRVIHSGTVSATQVTEALLTRIEAVDSSLNSYITVTADLAYGQAEAADREIEAGRIRGPLHGVPIAIKDIFDLVDVPTTAGMPIRRDAKATVDATVVRRLKEAGAVILGKTNLTEGVYAEHVDPFGAPVNPWAADRWPGASSSGSGVAVAAGLCYGAVSSDTGGSIRLPSAANGVTGLKPTWGRVSRHGVFELAATLDHIGPMARSATDAGAILSVIAGPDPLDPTASQTPVPSYMDAIPGDVRGLRIGIDHEWIRERVDAATVNVLYASVDTLKGLGAVVVDVTFPDPGTIIWDWFDVCAVQTALAHEATYPERKSEYGPALSTLLDLGLEMSAVDYQRVLLRRAEFSGRVQALFGAIDVLALPVLAFPTPTIERMRAVDDDMISGLHRFTCSFTMSGNPTITMPGAFANDGLPIAVQFAGPYFSEHRLVQLGSAFQSITDWHRRHPDLRA